LRLTKKQKYVLTVMKNFLEKNEKPKKNEEKEGDKKKATTNMKREERKIVNENISSKSDKIINYFIENQNQEDIKLPDFKVKSKQMRLFRKCLKLKKKNLNKIYDKTGKLRN
jgi:hypothetical protein